MMIASPQLQVWPQGKPSQVDDLRPDGHFGYLNEQVLWIRHQAIDDSRSALRVPETIRWAGKKKGDEPSENYQVGQCWESRSNKLLLDKCPLSYAYGESPGRLSAIVEFVHDESLQIEFTVENISKNRMEQVACHFCLNHRRAPLLGRRLFVSCSGQGRDFSKYIDTERNGWRRYAFNESTTHGDLPEVTEPLLFSETVIQDGCFTSVIGSAQASYLSSNTAWPCTDIGIDFGDIDSGRATASRIFVSFGHRPKDYFLQRMGSLISKNKANSG